MTDDRRAFLIESGSLLAGAALGAGVFAGPQSARASRNAAETIQCAWIGAGGRGSYLMSRAANVEGVAITAVCDVNEQHRTRAAATLAKRDGRKIAQFDDFRDLLDVSSIDALIVATPHHWHTPIAVRALEAGKHIYVEKPASHVFSEGRRLVEAAKKANRVFQHGTQMRSSEVTAEAGKVLKSGILGEIKQSKAWGVEPRRHPAPVADGAPPEFLDYDMWLGPAPKKPFNAIRFGRWNSFRDYGNGEIGGDGIHDIDMARWGLGVDTHPVQITAQGGTVHVTGASEFPDNMLATFQYADGRMLIYENRNFAPYKMHGWDNGNIFYGTEGYMVFSRRGYFQTYLGAKEKEGPGLRGSDGVERHVAGFFESVRKGSGSIADAEVAHLSCGLVHLGEIAYRTGRTLRFDPKQEAILGDSQAAAMLSKKYRGGWGFGAES
jgi:predicted dehydrogenase